MEGSQDSKGNTAPVFGALLLQQCGRCGFVGQLAVSGAAVRTFPRLGDLKAAGRRLQGQPAGGDDSEALDDAESPWVAL